MKNRRGSRGRTRYIKRGRGREGERDGERKSYGTPTDVRDLLKNTLAPLEKMDDMMPTSYKKKFSVTTDTTPKTMGAPRDHSVSM